MKKILLAVGLLGFALGWILAPQSQANLEASKGPQEEAGALTPRKSSRQSDGSIHRGLVRLTSALRNELHPVRRRILLDQILEKMTVENAGIIREGLSPMWYPDPRFIDFYRHWGQLAGSDIINLFGGKPKQMIFAGWAQEDPEAARNWAAGFETDGRKLDSAFHSALVTHLTPLNPEKATAHYFRHLQKGTHAAVLGKISGHIRETRGMTGWVAWAESLPASHRQTYYSKIARDWIEEDFEGARQWVENLEGEEGKWAVPAVAAHWQNQEGLEWAVSLPDEILRTKAIESSVRSWMKADREEAMTFLQEQEPSINRDLALSSALYRAKLPDFGAGLEWVSQITDPAIRMKALGDWAFYWYPKDPAGTDRWVDQSNLSAKAKRDYHRSKDSAR